MVLGAVKGVRKKDEGGLYFRCITKLPWGRGTISGLGVCHTLVIARRSAGEAFMVGRLHLLSRGEE
jgi:hypothetical protein